MVTTIGSTESTMANPGEPNAKNIEASISGIIKINCKMKLWINSSTNGDHTKRVEVSSRKRQCKLELARLEGGDTR